MMLIRIIFAVLVTSMFLLSGCGERENPAEPESPESGLVLQYARTFGTDQFPDFTWANFRSRVIRIYTPPKYPIQFSGDGAKYPTLYLLHDLNEDEVHFLKARIDIVADQLIASGEIQPMVIVMPDMSTPAGGTFLSDEWSMFDPDGKVIYEPGNFEKAIGEDLIRIMEADAYNPPDTIAFNIITKRASRAIGGIGMGGYSALRIAMKYPHIFSSVSIMNGMVSLIGEGDDVGVLDFVDKVFEENGIIKGDQDGYFNSIDTSYTRPFTNLFFSLSAAFSPHIPDTDSTTLLKRYQIDLPFDHNGALVQAVVDRWDDHDLIASLSEFETNDLFGVLDSTPVYVEYSMEDEFMTGEQSLALVGKLQSLGYSPTVQTFTGYRDLPARHNVFTYDRIAEMLKFHSANLSSDPTL